MDDDNVDTVCIQGKCGMALVLQNCSKSAASAVGFSMSSVGRSCGSDAKGVVITCPSDVANPSTVVSPLTLALLSGDDYPEKCGETSCGNKSVTINSAIIITKSEQMRHRKDRLSPHLAARATAR